MYHALAVGFSMILWIIHKGDFMLSVDFSFAEKFVDSDKIKGIYDEVFQAHNKLHKDKVFEPIGWLNLPKEYDENLVDEIINEAQNIREKCDVFVVIGIGGSYLGARAAIEFLHSNNYNLLENTPKIFFVGNSISSDELFEIMQICKNKKVCVNVISKSGTTTEPAIAFRFFKDFLESVCGKDGAKERIYCTTDSESNLKKLADEKGYKTFSIPRNIGGRYSVLSPVGLLPIAVSGTDIRKVLNGASNACNTYNECDAIRNDCYKYAAMRNLFYRQGKATEIMVGYHPKIHYFAEWWKQLFGESEGKNGKGIFPASAIFSTDLHSLGQYIQQGPKNLFETIINVKNPSHDLIISSSQGDLDNLNYLAGKTVNFVNQKALEATLLAHTNGGVPNIVLNLDSFSEENFGHLVYFFEKACAVSACLLGVNPFNQPGVENYKKEMFKLLGKPNFW